MALCSGSPRCLHIFLLYFARCTFTVGMQSGNTGGSERVSGIQPTLFPRASMPTCQGKGEDRRAVGASLHPLLSPPCCLLTSVLPYSLTYSLTYLLTYLLIYLPAYLLIYLPACLLTDLLTYLLIYLPVYLLTCLLTCLLNYLLTYFFTYLFTCLLTYLLTY